MAKGAIQGSALPQMTNQLWSKENARRDGQEGPRESKIASMSHRPPFGVSRQ